MDYFHCNNIMTAISVVISVNTIAVSKNNDDAMATLGNLILGI